MTYKDKLIKNIAEIGKLVVAIVLMHHLYYPILPDAECTNLSFVSGVYGGFMAASGFIVIAFALADKKDSPPAK